MYTVRISLFFRMQIIITQNHMRIGYIHLFFILYGIPLIIFEKNTYIIGIYAIVVRVISYIYISIYYKKRECFF